jgi:hypothetical protein
MAGDRRTLGQMFGIGFPSSTKIGVRIRAVVGVQYTDMETGEPFTEYNVIDITVNAYGYDRIGDVLDSAVTWVNEGGLRRAGRSRKDFVVEEAHVLQLIIGGLDNAALNL